MRKLILAAGAAALLLTTSLSWAHGVHSSIYWQIQVPLGGHYGQHDHQRWQNNYGAWWRHRDQGHRHQRRHWRRDHSHGHGGHRHDHRRGRGRERERGGHRH